MADDDVPTDSQATRLFVVCGRGRQPEELRRLFCACGAVQSLHLALDRSGRSRGFAFLQYREPASALAAIARFHQFRLDDGHVLKVTIAKDKPVVALGKLKRDQQQSILEVQSDGGSTAGDDAHVSGKRQRPSPPPVPHAAAAAAVASSEPAPRRKMRVSAAAAPSVEAAAQPPPPARPDDAVANALDDMLVAVQSAGDHPATLQTLVTGYALIAEHRSRVRATARGEAGGRREETSTEQLTSSIHSFSLDAFPSAAGSAAPPQPHRLSVLAPAFGGVVRATSTSDRAAKASLLRRRRESDDESDSSVDGASDASMSRRKRSNVGQREPSNWVAASGPAASESPAASLAPPNKPCKRQSSDQSADAAARSAKQRVTTARSRHAVAPEPSTSLTPHLAAAAIETERPRTKLFFIASRKFTMQELEAMFFVYGDFEAVDVVKSFGRIKTMAYVHYSNPRTATSVLESFQEETRLDADVVASEFMKLSFAEDDRRSSPFLPVRQMDHALFASSLPTPSPPARAQRDAEKLWLLLLYDRSLPSNLISMCASRCVGMQFVDIKVFRSTGKAQGVAFVKFESEGRAVEAAHELHKLELPTGSGKFMQAIVISDPSVFSTMHGGSQPSNWIGEHPGGGDGSEAGDRGSDDVDLSAVEAKFAHLMRSSDQGGSAFSAGRPRILSEESASGSHHQTWPHPLWPASPQHPMMFAHHHQLQHSAQAYAYYPHQQLQQPQQFAAYSPHAGQHVAYVQPHPQWTEFPAPTSFFHYPHPSSSFVSTQVAGVHPPEYYAQAYPAPSFVGVEVPSSVVSGEGSPDGTTDTESFATTIGGAAFDGSDGATRSSSIFISSCRPLDLVAVARELDGCAGVDGITKDGEGSDAVFVVEFVDAAQAAAAVEKLDGKMSGGKKLRVAAAVGKGGKPRAAPSRRKRQRVDPRTRK